MNDETRQPIREQLEVYAAARRREAGGAFDLPPDSRQVLCAEVARVYGDHEKVRTSGIGWGVGWLRLAVGSIVLALVAAWGWFSWLGRPTPAPTLLAAKSSQAPPAVPAHSTGTGLTQAKEVSTGMPSNRWVAAAPTAIASPRPTMPAPAAVPTVRPPSASTRAQAETGDRTRVASPDTSTAVAQPVVDVSRRIATATSGSEAVRPMASPPPQRLNAGITGQPVASFAAQAWDAKARPDQSFAFSQAPGGSATRRNLNSPPPMPVLNRFQIQTQGDRIRVIDADESSYDGTVDWAVAHRVAGGPAGPKAMSARLREPRMERARTASANQEPGRELASAVPESPGAVLALPFQAEGTNRTLNQRVRIEGQLVWVGKNGRSAADSGSVQAWLSNSTVLGHVVVGEKSRFDLDAAPAPDASAGRAGR